MPSRGKSNYKAPADRSGYGSLGINVRRHQPQAVHDAVELSTLVATEPLERHFAPPHQGHGKGRWWICKCKRRHRVANVVRADFECTFCHEHFRLD